MMNRTCKIFSKIEDLFLDFLYIASSPYVFLAFWIVLAMLVSHLIFSYRDAQIEEAQEIMDVCLEELAACRGFFRHDDW